MYALDYLFRKERRMINAPGNVLTEQVGGRTDLEKAIGWLIAHEYHECGHIEDGYGNAWSKTCPKCKQDTMQIIRPGKVQCGECG
jgi:hypothetical protein